jgi:hypothetical protein
MDGSSPGFDVSLSARQKALYGKRPQKTSFEILARLLDSEGLLIDKSTGLKTANKPNE